MCVSLWWWCFWSLGLGVRICVPGEMVCVRACVRIHACLNLWLRVCVSAWSGCAWWLCVCVYEAEEPVCVCVSACGAVCCVSLGGLCAYAWVVYVPGLAVCVGVWI